jgi:hypothetical protein
VGALVTRIEETTDFVEPDAATSGFRGTVSDGHGDDEQEEDHG